MSKTWYSDLPQYYQRQIRAMGLDEAGLNRRRLLKGMSACLGAQGLLPPEVVVRTAPLVAVATLRTALLAMIENLAAEESGAEGGSGSA